MERQLPPTVFEFTNTDERTTLLYKIEMLIKQHDGYNKLLYQDMRKKSISELKYIIRTVEYERDMKILKERKKQVLRDMMVGTSAVVEKLATDKILPLDLDSLTDDVQDTLYPSPLPPIPTEEQLQKQKYAEDMDKWIDDFADEKEDPLQLNPELKFLLGMVNTIMLKHIENKRK